MKIKKADMDKILQQAETRIDKRIIAVHALNNITSTEKSEEIFRLVKMQQRITLRRDRSNG